GGGPPYQQDPAVEAGVGEAEPDQAGRAVQPGGGEHRDADLFGGQLGHDAQVAGLGGDPGGEPGGVAGRLERAAQFAGGGEGDDRLVAQRTQRDLAASGQRGGGGHGGHHPVPGPQQGLRGRGRAGA